MTVGHTTRAAHMLTRVLFTFVTAVWLAGCAAPGPRNFDRGVEALASKDYETAYRFLEHPNTGTEGQVLALMQRNPELPAAGAKTFTHPALMDSIGRYGRADAFKIEHSRLQRYAVYANSDTFQAATENFAAVFPEELAAYHQKEAERTRVANLPEAEQQRYWAEQFRKSVEATTVRGTILSSQLIDLSRPGTTAGANLGALLGQAIYIDSTSWGNYRATSQVAAGLLGALLGAESDQRPTILYQKIYFIRTKDGEAKRIEEQTSSPILLPVGGCLMYREPFHLSLVPERECAQR